jgi:hypothetical protein
VVAGPVKCSLCDEPMHEEENINRAVGWPMHRECTLRMALGGIGHLIAHDYWCTQKHDPDAGLTYRQSALLTDAYVRVMGVEASVQ